MLIRPATAADAARLSDFARESFVDTFAASNTAEDMAQFVAETYSPELQAREIAEDIVLLLEERRDLAGFAHLKRGRAPGAVTGPAPIELNRFYIGKGHHGKGLAQRLMQRVLEVARDEGAQTLWLGVWEHNARAIAFYRKLGFERVGEHTFVLGSDVQTDWLMQRPV